LITDTTLKLPQTAIRSRRVVWQSAVGDGVVANPKCTAVVVHKEFPGSRQAIRGSFNVVAFVRCEADAGRTLGLTQFAPYVNEYLVAGAPSIS